MARSNFLLAATESLARRVSCTVVAEIMGIAGTHGQVLCPICDSERPEINARLDISETSFHCSEPSCNVRGDVIDLIEVFTNLSRSEAVETILRVNAGQKVDLEVTSARLVRTSKGESSKAASELDEYSSFNNDIEASTTEDSLEQTLMANKQFLDEDGDVRQIIFNARDKKRPISAEELLAVYIRQSYFPLLTKGEENYLGGEIASRFKKIVTLFFSTDYALSKAEKLLDEICSGNKSKHRVFGTSDEVLDSIIWSTKETISKTKQAEKQFHREDEDIETTANLRRNCVDSLSQLKFKPVLVMTWVRDFLRLINQARLFDSNITKSHAATSGELVPLVYEIHRDRKGFEYRVNELKNEHRFYIRAIRDLAKGSLRLVVHIALKYRNKGLPFIDVLQAGNVGLLIACRKFDILRGTRFSTYATYWIRQQILREIADHATLVRIPVPARDDLQKLMISVEYLTFQLEKEPDIDELNEHIGRKNAEYFLPFTKEVVSLSDPQIRRQLESEILKQENGNLLEHASEQSEIKELVNDMLELLDERQQEIIKRRFGIGWGEEQTLEEVGSAFGVTRERIRQIESKCLEKLQNCKLRKKASQLIN